MRGKADDALDWIALAWGKFDYCLDFTRNDRSSFLTLLSQAQKRITSDHPNLRTKIRARSYNEFVESPVRHLHTVDYHLALLKPLGIDDASRAIRLDLPDSTVEKAEQLLKIGASGGRIRDSSPGFRPGRKILGNGALGGADRPLRARTRDEMRSDREAVLRWSEPKSAPSKLRLVRT